MPNHDLKNRTPFKLMRGRLGAYNKQSETEVASIKGIVEPQIRLQQHGGNKQQERMIKDKRRSLDHAVKYSYQAAEIRKLSELESQPAPALINPNQLKQDYDDKILSVGFEYNIHCGDTIEWLGTNTYWLVYLQDMTELAYFRGNIRKCSYTISWQEADKTYVTHVAVKGPAETRLKSQKINNIGVDVPNYSISLLLPKDDAILNYFKRYNKFYLNDDNTCWRIEALDWISTPGILEVTAVEYYSNEHEDDVPNGIVGGLIVQPEPPENSDAEIIGETFIKVKKTYSYAFNGTLACEWSVDSDAPVVLTPCKTDPRKVEVRWISSYSGQFVLHYGDFSKTIVVESLF